MDNYRVAKYFDDHLESWIGEPTTEELAKKKANELNDKVQSNLVRFHCRKLTSKT